MPRCCRDDDEKPVEKTPEQVKAAAEEDTTKTAKVEDKPEQKRGCGCQC